MADKPIKQITTSCPFPLLIYPVNIRYNEVRKASGIAYILLEMIDKATASAEKISDVLLKFGIPSELHYIFGKEIAGLIGTEIIESAYPSSYFNEPRYFSQIKMGEIKLTQKGKVMFRDKAIPTGQEKVKQKEIYFDPVRRKFDIAYPISHADISTSALGEDFIDRLKLDISGMGDYINANPTKMGLKAEEKIISFETEEPQKRAVKPEDNLTILITSKGVEFKFATSDETAFFNKYFTSEIIERVIAFKPRYRFTDRLKNSANIPTIPFEELDAANFYIPDDLTKQAKTACNIFLERGGLDYESDDEAIRFTDAAILDGLDKDAEFAMFDLSGCRYYRALNVEFPCEQLKDVFKMQLLVENTATDEQFGNAVTGIFNVYKSKPFDIECSKVITYAAAALKNSELFEIYANEKLSEIKTVDDKIEFLLKLNSAFAKSKGWDTCFKRLAENYYADSVKEVKLDNVIYKNTVLSPLVKAVGMLDIDYITSFSQNVAKTEDPTLVYQALSSAGFDTGLILGIVNVIDLYLRAVLDGEPIIADGELALQFSVLQTNFNKLNTMLGVESLSDYTIKEDYNVDEFFNAYGTFISTCRTLEKYSRYAEKEFKELEGYKTIYDTVHELLSIERTASSHPEKITEKYINEYIDRGRYKDAICDLLVKLQFDLRKILQADSTMQANELIDMAKEKGFIDGKEASALHKLRICRNRLQHPDGVQAQFNKNDIENWRDMVFSIGGNK